MTGLDWMYIKPQQPTSMSPPLPVAQNPRAHPGNEEVPWDSPIEDVHASTAYCHSTEGDYYLHHQHHFYNTVSGASSPHTMPSPGYDATWDSPILEAEDEDELHTPLSDMLDEDHMSDFFSSKPKSQQQLSVPHTTKPNATQAIRLSHPTHPSLGSTNGHFSSSQQHKRRHHLHQGEECCELRDSNSREEFLWHITGVCSCGRKAAMTTVMTPLRERRNSFCESA